MGAAPLDMVQIHTKLLRALQRGRGGTVLCRPLIAASIA
jgi:hypothetical protein